MKRILNLIFCGSLMLAGLVSCGTADKSAKSIKSVEKVVVESPEGTVPRLPYQLWVTYNDGTGAYRQVRWSNSALAVESSLTQLSILPERSTLSKDISQETTRLRKDIL